MVRAPPALATSMPSTTVRLIYPQLPDPLTLGDRQRLFAPSCIESDWALTVARTPAAQVALLVQLKVFQIIGRFLSPDEIPLAVIERVARRLGVAAESTLVVPERTLHRHRAAILLRLRVVSWGTQGRGIALEAMQTAAGCGWILRTSSMRRSMRSSSIGSSCHLWRSCADWPVRRTTKSIFRSGRASAAGSRWLNAGHWIACCR